jgi:hypothetical protein
MKLLKYIQLSLLLLLTFVTFSFAQTYQTFEGSVGVDAAVTEDTNSTLTVLPNTVEIMERALVTVTIRGGDLQPLPDHYIQLVAPGLTFTQPTQPSNAEGKITVQVYAANPGSYNICAQDITYDDLVIDILDCDTLYVTIVDVPTLLEEPQYTKGTSNTLFWTSIGSGYNYFIQASEQSDFSSIKSTSTWISGTLFEFSNLENAKMYFYRVKARNSFGGESSWSNVRYSVQDDEPPVITPLSVSSIGDNNRVEWESSYEIEIKYKVEDNLSLADTSFSCVRQDGSKYSCGQVTNNGVLYTAKVKLSELERDGLNDLYSTYNFCVDAQDSAGNTSENCDFEIQIPPWQSPQDPEEPITEPTPEPEPEKPPQEIPTYVGRIVRDVVDNTQIMMDNMFGNLDDYSLQDISTTTAIATITLSIGSILGGLLYIPIYLFQFLLSLLSWLGLRKKGKPSGYVYDSNTKEPISQAVVRVYSKDGQLVWTDVTGSRGYFTLALDDGEYSIRVTAREYEFPSRVVFGKSDYPLENVYHGEEFVVKDGVVAHFSIPLDSVEMGWFTRNFATLRSRFRVLYKVLSLVFFVFGLMFSIYIYNINPTWFSFVIILLYIPSFVLVVRALFKKDLEYGVVKLEDGTPVKGISIGLRDKEYGEIVAKRVTDGKGRYRFVVDRGDYNIEILETGHEVVEIEEEESRELSDGSVLIALDTVVKGIEVEN